MSGRLPRHREAGLSIGRSAWPSPPPHPEGAGRGCCVCFLRHWVFSSTTTTVPLIQLQRGEPTPTPTPRVGGRFLMISQASGPDRHGVTTVAAHDCNPPPEGMGSVASHGLAQGCLGRRDPFLFASSAHGFCQTQSPSLLLSPPHAGGGGGRPAAPSGPSSNQARTRARLSPCSFGISVACLGPPAPDHWAAGFHTHSLPSSEHRPSGLAFDPLSSGQVLGVVPPWTGGHPTHHRGPQALSTLLPLAHIPFDDPRTGTHPLLFGACLGQKLGDQGPRTPFPHKAAGAGSTA